MDELSHGARALLRAADSHDDPSAEDASRVRRAVLAQVGAIGIGTALVAASSTQAKAASIGAMAAKLTAAVALTVGGVTAWGYATESRQAVQAPPVAKAQARAESKAQAKPVEAAVEAAPLVAAEDIALEAAPPAPASVAKATGRRVGRVAEPAAPAETLEIPEPAVKAAPAQAALEAEIKLLRGADTALRGGNTSAALSLLQQHQTEHPRASLAHEREGLRAIIQCQVGAPGSRAAAERFVQASPRSTMAARLRGACRIGD